MKKKNDGLYIGRGNASMQDDYIDFINYVFGFNGADKDFYKLLPKLYKPEYNPAGQSYVVLENGRLRAAVGAFSHELDICGIRLKCRGIGNVAVHPFSRSKGYMRETMEMAVGDMVKDGVDLSILGGMRARYNYFSYERAGTELCFRIGASAMRHRFGADRKSELEYRIINSNEDSSLDVIAALSDKQSYRPIRPREKLYDILRSWHQVPVAVYKGDTFVGYIVCGDGTINEALSVRTEDWLPMIVGAYDLMKKREITVKVPLFRPDLAEMLYGFAEGYDVTSSKMYSVLCFRRVILAFLTLKTAYEPLPSGELCLLIHGRGGDERLLISVTEEGVSVTETDRSPDLTLDHIDAMNLVFASYCPSRLTLPSFAKLWFPLPLWIYASDTV